MASKQKRGGSSRRLLAALGLTAAAGILLLLLAEGHVYRVTQGAEIGLYATMAVLFAGVCLAGGACYLAATSLLRGHRRLDNVVSIDAKQSARKERTKGQRAA